MNVFRPGAPQVTQTHRQHYAKKEAEQQIPQPKNSGCFKAAAAAAAAEQIVGPRKTAEQNNFTKGKWLHLQNLFIIALRLPGSD